MLSLDIILIDDNIDKTIEELKNYCPQIDWQYEANNHDLGAYYSVCVDDTVEGFDEDLVFEIERLFNARDFDALAYL